MQSQKQTILRLMAEVEDSRNEMFHNISKEFDNEIMQAMDRNDTFELIRIISRLEDMLDN